jgi:hypothetical protein
MVSVELIDLYPTGEVYRTRNARVDHDVTITVP